MTDLQFTYSDEEYGWVSERLTLGGNILLFVSLKAKGYTVIKKKNTDGVEEPKAYESPYTDELSLRVTKSLNDMEIRIFTSEEPNYIKYENI